LITPVVSVPNRFIHNDLIQKYVENVHMVKPISAKKVTMAINIPKTLQLLNILNVGLPSVSNAAYPLHSGLGVGAGVFTPESTVGVPAALDDDDEDVVVVVPAAAVVVVVVDVAVGCGVGAMM